MLLATGILLLGLLVAAGCLVAAGPKLISTTLIPARRWAVAAIAGWIAAVGESLWRTTPEAGAQDVLWYLAAVLSLCPPVAVLGAKRPGTRVWTWFVLLPLVAVLTLPALGPPLLMSGGWSIRIPLPLMIGFAVVLLMGVGNYAGTRYGLSAAMLGIAICLVVAPLSDAAPQLPASPANLRLWGAALLIAGILWGLRQSARPTVANTPWDRVWFDYRDTFGIVWGRRMLERVNERALAEQWDWRLSDAGFIPAVGTQPQFPVDADPRIDHTFRWLLRRFVDPEWIDQRMDRNHQQ